MLIVCDENELMFMRSGCHGDCDTCVFSKVRCPIEKNMIITHQEILNGKELSVKNYW